MALRSEHNNILSDSEYCKVHVHKDKCIPKLELLNLLEHAKEYQIRYRGNSDKKFRVGRVYYNATYTDDSVVSFSIKMVPVIDSEDVTLGYDLGRVWKEFEVSLYGITWTLRYC